MSRGTETHHLTAVKRTQHIYDSQGQILVSAFRQHFVKLSSCCLFARKWTLAVSSWPGLVMQLTDTGQVCTGARTRPSGCVPGRVCDESTAFPSCTYAKLVHAPSVLVHTLNPKRQTLIDSPAPTGVPRSYSPPPPGTTIGL